MDADSAAVLKRKRTLHRQLRALHAEGTRLVEQLRVAENQDRPARRSALCDVARGEMTLVQEWCMLIRDLCAACG